jgi:FkbM family methyltransferase
VNGLEIRYRLNRGDMQSIREVLLDEVYRFPADLGQVRTVVDLGANIGLTSVYLASRYGAEALVAVEPVAANAELVRQNLALNGINGAVIEAAVGVGPDVAYFHEDAQSNTGHLSTAGTAVAAVTMGSIFERLDGRSIDLLKIDIEGAEGELFSGDRSWLSGVRALMIEFHPGRVDSSQIRRDLIAAGFRHIPVGSVRNSTDAFLRDSLAA